MTPPRYRIKSKSKQLNDNQSKENQYHNKVIESSENKSIKEHDNTSGNESKQYTKLTSKGLHVRCKF